MEENQILDGLNDKQREAVISKAPVIRVIAGAGSGKTKVLVQRMLWLTAIENISPYALLILTFTNKAANEIKQRIENAFEYPVKYLWVGTFHGICHRILRRYAQLMDWSDKFVIMDNDDQLRLLKRIMRENDVDENTLNPKQLLRKINYYKENGLRAEHIPAPIYPTDHIVQKIYINYENICRQQGTMDFNELLLLTVELLQRHEEIRKEYGQKFLSVLVDEFQDTNTLQYHFIRLLCQDGAALFVVGDDDQSIYGWRGAKIENILQLEKDFPAVETIRLEQNYRSTQNILDAANSVISYNSNRVGKTLWSHEKRGSLIYVYPAVNEYDEARYVCEQIVSLHQNGESYRNCVILYRSNAQSRIFEELLLQYQLPYIVYGGLRFFERAEIKDALAYLRASYLLTDDNAIERIINNPPRGIGAKTFGSIRTVAQENKLSLWETLNNTTLLNTHFKSRALNALSEFVRIIKNIREKIITEESLEKVLKIAVYDSGLYGALENNKSEQAENKCHNLQELINAGAHTDSVSDSQDKIADFLNVTALNADDDIQPEKNSNNVRLMTLHSAKGLEFPTVFMVGMEENLFPTQRAVNAPEQLEEERRLAYVGMTRAQKQLTLCFAERRHFQGQPLNPKPSRFIREIPEHLIHFVRPMEYSAVNPTIRLTEKIQDNNLPFKIGEAVQHPKFGYGRIIATEGSGEHLRFLVRFTHAGEKWLVYTYAKLEKA